MRRGRLLDISDCCIHVTQRCRNRQFLLTFACDRRNDVSRLRAASLRYHVEFLDYVVTSNYVHLLLWAPSLGGATGYLVRDPIWNTVRRGWQRGVAGDAGRARRRREEGHRLGGGFAPRGCGRRNQELRPERVSVGIGFTK